MGTWQSGYQELVVWKEARKLVILTYHLTEKFPRNEDYGLKSQIRRAAVSIIANIAEGWIRRTIKDKLRFLEISEGSLLELETEAIVALDVKYLSQKDFDEFDQQRSRVAFLLYRYQQSIAKQP